MFIFVCAAQEHSNLNFGHPAQVLGGDHRSKQLPAVALVAVRSSDDESAAWICGRFDLAWPDWATLFLHRSTWFFETTTMPAVETGPHVVNCQGLRGASKRSRDPDDQKFEDETCRPLRKGALRCVARRPQPTPATGTGISMTISNKPRICKAAIGAARQMSNPTASLQPHLLPQWRFGSGKQHANTPTPCDPPPPEAPARAHRPRGANCPPSRKTGSAGAARLTESPEPPVSRASRAAGACASSGLHGIFRFWNRRRRHRLASHSIREDAAPTSVDEQMAFSAIENQGIRAKRPMQGRLAGDLAPIRGGDGDRASRDVLARYLGASFLATRCRVAGSRMPNVNTHGISHQTAAAGERSSRGGRGETRPGTRSGPGHFVEASAMPNCCTARGGCGLGWRGPRVASVRTPTPGK